MRTTTTTYWAAAACLSLVGPTAAEFLQGRQNSQDSGSSTAFPTVPSFSQNSYTYGYFSQVYPSGYTVPSGAVDTGTLTATLSATASATGSRIAGSNGYIYSPAESSQLDYIRSMCVPQPTSDGSSSSPGLDTGFPCNEVKNITFMCVYNEQSLVNSSSSLTEQTSQAQQQCLCPGGPGAAIWENAEACSDCLRLHGASALNETVHGYEFVPTAFVKDFSSAYCAMPTATLNYQHFAKSFTQTHAVSYGSETGGVDLLKGKTAVSDYFTSTSAVANSTSSSTTSAPARTGGGGSQSPAANLPTTTNSPSTSSPAANPSAGAAGTVKVSGLLGVALFPPGSKAFTFTTSSHKKRRLSPPESTNPHLASAIPAPHGPSSPVSQQTQPLPSPSRLTHPDPSSTATSSPPRYIPQHLVLEGARNHRSPTPEIFNTAASSPSAACAGLALDTESSGDTSSVEGRGTSCRGASLAGKDKQSGGFFSNRSSSPATKRLASDMEGTNKSASGTNGHGTANKGPPVKEGLTSTITARRTSLGQHVRHKREVSVDMTANQAGPPSDSTPLPSVPEDKPTSLLNGAYQTPESATSTLESSIGGQETSDISSTSSAMAPDLPPIDEQINTVKQICAKEMEEGQKGYVVSRRWLARVLSRGSDTEEVRKYGKEAKEGPIGRVDNTGLNLVVDPTLSDLRDEKGDAYTPLRPGLVYGDDYEVLPQQAWERVIQWYGLAKGSAVLPRYCHNTSPNDIYPNMQYEVYPPIFTVLVLVDKLTPKYIEKLTAGQPVRPVKLLASRHELFQHFLKRAKLLAGVDLKDKVRVHKIFGGLGEGSQAGILTPAQSRSSSPAPGITPAVDAGQTLELDASTFNQLELGSQREKLEIKDESYNDNYNGSSTMDLVGLRGDNVLVLERSCRPIERINEFTGDTYTTGGGEWLSHKVLGKHPDDRVPEQFKRKANASSGRSTPAPKGGLMTRGRAAKHGKIRGSMGLGNLGNTCYMNSALQCIRSVEELTEYFLMKKYKGELNPENPLAHNGAVATAYANLVGEMYGDHMSTSFSPRQFKNTISKYGPAFSGYGQQDSQEFLLFLLDGLQEDLNRIKDKPYTQKPDSTDEMVENPAALRAFADRCWDLYKARNDSIITDLFAGMYKSTVVCPVCDKVSIIFDPFNNLTLQLPIENVWSHKVYYFPLRSRPVALDVDIDKNATILGLKEYVAKRVGADARKMIALEIYKNKFYKIYDDKSPIIEERITEQDDVGIYELEYPLADYPALKKKQKKVLTFSRDDEEEDYTHKIASADKFMVAVFQRIPRKAATRYERNQYDYEGVPFIITVTAEEARDYDEILCKVLKHVEPLSSRDFLRENEESEAESDMVMMNSDEADSSSESKIQTTSLASEDGMIHVSVHGSGEESPAAPASSGSLEVPKAKALPPMLKPGASVTSEVRDLFEMKYCHIDGDMIPTGFSSLSDDSKFDVLASRKSKPSQERPLTNGEKISRVLDRDDGNVSSDEDAASPSEPALVQGYESDSDGLPPVAQLTRGFSKSNSRLEERTVPRNRPLITYSRKDKRPAVNGNSNTSREQIINFGEVIALDWAPEAWDGLFGGNRDNSGEMRGVAQWKYPFELKDPEREQKEKLRKSRKKYGVTLADCLDEFGRPEILSEADAWYCPRCKEHRRAAKTFEIWKSPDILVVHLKRFCTQGRLRDKLDILVDFPVAGLDLASRVCMRDDGTSAVYDLFAIDNHYGGLGGGHYTAYAKNLYDGCWYEYNDTSVTKIHDQKATQKVVTSAAYILFYRRRSASPLGGQFFERLLSGGEAATSDSQPNSPAASPSGEGRRLDDFSRTGSSSAFQGVGAAHQAGGGGLTGTTHQRTGVDDDLPAYGPNPQDFDTMDLDEDEGIGGMGPVSLFRNYPERQPSWSFGDDVGARPYSTQVAAAPPGSDEDLFEGEGKSSPSSTRVARSGPPSEDGRDQNMRFLDDEGTTSGFLGTPEARTTPEGRFVSLEDEELDAPVLDVRVPDE